MDKTRKSYSQSEERVSFTAERNILFSIQRSMFSPHCFKHMVSFWFMFIWDMKTHTVLVQLAHLKARTKALTSGIFKKEAAKI